MAKDEMTSDMWLHILSKTVANYAAAGARVEVIDDYEIGAVTVVLYDVEPDDDRLHPDFRTLVNAHMRCMDCGVDTGEIGEDYMVIDEVWLKAHPDNGGKLCVGCLEKRLGRILGPADFSHYPINIPDEETSDRLKSRLWG